MNVDKAERPGAEGDLYLVVHDDEEQYSIWRADRDIPAGWHAVGDPRSKEDCLAYIDTHWTDMRPKSLRQAMEG